jgi:quercetin dioxygenase-like cupin family protein
MQVQRWHEAPSEQMNALVARQVVHGANITMARLTLSKGAVVPEHHHVNEQITTITEGKLLFRLNGIEQLLSAGESLVIPPNLPHSVEALEDTVALDVFAPIREDWLRGDDAYLRK